MRATLATTVLAASICAVAHAAQGSSEFEVASVKPSEQTGRSRLHLSGGPGTQDPTKFVARDISLSFLIMQAYAVRQEQVQCASTKARY
jgi:uncharacterized protein (TIGR03435 family)